jgi:aminopeptidase
MFTEELLQKYADVMIWALEKARKTTGGEFKEKDVVLLRYELDSLKLAENVYRKLLEKRFNVVRQVNPTTKMEFDFYDVGNEEQLKFLEPWTKVLYKNINGLITLRAPASLTHLKTIDPEKMALEAKAIKPLMDIRDKREEAGEFGWTLCMMPTLALAEQAKLPLEEYEQEIIKACYLDKKNPVEEWENLYRESSAIKNWLNLISHHIDYLQIESASADLKIKIGERRKWLGVSGHNIPSFEIFTSPDLRGTEGVYFANMPSLRQGNCVEGVKLVFRKGKAVKIQAVNGEEFVWKTLDTDKGAKFIGEFSLTDKRFSPITKFMANTLFDENVGGENGNCHIAVGASYSDTFNGNPKELTKKIKKALGYNDSAIHWDLINTEDKNVTARLKSGEKVVIYEAGMFKNQ